MPCIDHLVEKQYVCYSLEVQNCFNIDHLSRHCFDKVSGNYGTERASQWGNKLLLLMLKHQSDFQNNSNNFLCK